MPTNPKPLKLNAEKRLFAQQTKPKASPQVATKKKTINSSRPKTPSLIEPVKGRTMGLAKKPAPVRTVQVKKAIPMPTRIRNKYSLKGALRGKIV